MNALERFKRAYQQLDKNNLPILRAVYSDDISFSDPLHQVNGINSLIEYFAKLYENVEAISFAFGEAIADRDKTTITWVMTVRHPRLNGGQDVYVEGISYLHFNTAGMVYYHRDYFDLGAMLYEQIPLLGRVIKKLKERVAS